MADAMDDLQMEVITITLDRTTGRVGIDHEGVNYLEAIGMLTVGLNLLQDQPFDYDYGDDDDDEDL
jgi:hypothetical protein